MRALFWPIFLVACTPRVAPLAPDQAPTVTLPPPSAPTRSWSSSVSLAVGQDWSGKFACSHGETLVILHVERVDGARVQGALLFREQATGAAGSYDVGGTFDFATGVITLEAGDWIDRPEGHTKERVTGVLHDRMITGSFGTPSCLLSLSLTDGLPTFAEPEE